MSSIRESHSQARFQLQIPFSPTIKSSYHARRMSIEERPSRSRSRAFYIKGDGSNTPQLKSKKVVQCDEFNTLRIRNMKQQQLKQDQQQTKIPSLSLSPDKKEMLRHKVLSVSLRNGRDGNVDYTRRKSTFLES